MTNIQQQDARLIAIDAATVAAIRLHASEFGAADLDDNLPRWFQRLLDRCTITAEHVADRTDAAFIEIVSALLGNSLGRGQAMADHDAPRNSAGSSVTAIGRRSFAIAAWKGDTLQRAMLFHSSISIAPPAAPPMRSEPPLTESSSLIDNSRISLLMFIHCF